MNSPFLRLLPFFIVVFNLVRSDEITHDILLASYGDNLKQQIVDNLSANQRLLQQPPPTSYESDQMKEAIIDNLRSIQYGSIAKYLQPYGVGYPSRSAGFQQQPYGGLGIVGNPNNYGSGGVGGNPYGSPVNGIGQQQPYAAVNPNIASLNGGQPYGSSQFGGRK